MWTIPRSFKVKISRFMLSDVGEIKVRKIGVWNTKTTFYCTVEIRYTCFVWQIFILDHRIWYDICSTQQDLQNKPLHECAAQSWSFNVFAKATLAFVVILTSTHSHKITIHVLYRHEMYLSTKYVLNPSIGLGGVWAETNKQIHTEIHRIETSRQNNNSSIAIPEVS